MRHELGSVTLAVLLGVALASSGCKMGTHIPPSSTPAEPRSAEDNDPGQEREPVERPRGGVVAPVAAEPRGICERVFLKLQSIDSDMDEGERAEFMSDCVPIVEYMAAEEQEGLRMLLGCVDSGTTEDMIEDCVERAVDMDEMEDRAEAWQERRPPGWRVLTPNEAASMPSRQICEHVGALFSADGKTFPAEELQDCREQVDRERREDPEQFRYELSCVMAADTVDKLDRCNGEVRKMRDLDKQYGP